MKVKVYAPFYVDIEAIDDDNYMVLDEQATISEVFEKLKIPLPYRDILIFTVNYKKATQSQILHDGDIVSFLTIITGG